VILSPHTQHWTG